MFKLFFDSLPTWAKVTFLTLQAQFRKKDLTLRHDRLASIRPDDILLFCVLRNEKVRIPYFLKYYREMGVNHFLFIDNESDDGLEDYLKKFEDCSLWRATGSYRKARSGLHWSRHLLNKYGTGHWCLIVDPDEFLIYPDCEKNNLTNLTYDLEKHNSTHLFTFMLDMYSKDTIQNISYTEGQNPLEVCEYFDKSGYTLRTNEEGHINVRGGLRGRAFFKESNEMPALNKYPLIKWQQGCSLLYSTHYYVRNGWAAPGMPKHRKVTGCLLHQKFLPMVIAKVEEEKTRKEHYNQGSEYLRYKMDDTTCFFDDNLSVRYKDSSQLAKIGLLSCEQNNYLFDNFPRQHSL